MASTQCATSTDLPGRDPDGAAAGHTLGHAGVAIDTPQGWLLHAGDAYLHRDELVGGTAAHAARARDLRADHDDRSAGGAA